MNLVLLGDSHLARLQRDLSRLGDDVENLAVGGARVRHLPGQVAGVPASARAVVLSIGTNDAATGGTPLPDFEAGLADALRRLGPARTVYLAPPGVREPGAPAAWDPRQVGRYREVACGICEDLRVPVLRADRVVAPLGTRAFADDGLHLSGAGYDALLPEIRGALQP